MVQAASAILGVGMAVPERIVSNTHFTAYLDTSDEWIRDRTGISERRWADADTQTSDLASIACQEAISNAGLKPEEIDGIICATVTADMVFPSTACILQKRLGLKRGFAFDLNAVCSGFIYALSTADSFIARGQGQTILVVGVDLFSKLIDRNDRSTCILFGDGAGAVVLGAATRVNPQVAPVANSRYLQGSNKTIRGIYGSLLSADGAGGNLLHAKSSNPIPNAPPAEHHLKMSGKEVFKLAVRCLGEISEQLLSQFDLTVGDVDYFISHQANKRILQAMSRELHVNEEKVLSNVDRYGNTSAASVPLLLAENVRQGRFKPGDLLLLSAFGGGITWGAVLVRW